MNSDDMPTNGSSSEPESIVPDPLMRTPLGAIPQADMNEVMDALQFDQDNIPMPWDTEGNLTAFGDVIGTPDVDTPFWQLQTTGFTYAVVAQRGIIEAFTGVPISEAQLVYDATVNGWLSDGGMSPMDVGNLLRLYGIDCHEATGANIEALMAELAQGHKVIVGVDSGEIWNQDYPLEDFFHQAADHAIWVTGINLDDPNNPKVIVNDSGDPNGAGKEYELSVFVDAWEDSGFLYVATDDAPLDFHLAARGFDPAQGVFSDMVSYFGRFASDFQETLQRQGQNVESVTETLTGGPALQTLTDNPIASLDETARDDLLKQI
jgi:hypothetical protein